MKRISLILLLTFFSTKSIAQTQRHKNQNAYFVKAAAEKYNLSEQQQQELSKVRLEFVVKFIGIIKKFKKGEVTAEERQKLIRELNKDIHKYFIKTFNVSNYKEMEPFLKQIKQELKDIK